MAHILTVANRFYSARYQTHPLLTLSCTNAGLAALSDVLAQSITRAKSQGGQSTEAKIAREVDVMLPPARHHDSVIPKTNDLRYDLPRTVRLATYGFAIAPLVHSWYSVLDRRFPLPLSSGNALRGQAMAIRTVLKRVAVDQITFAPIGLGLFFGVMAVLEGSGTQGIIGKIDEAFIPALKANYTVWPLVQFVNFRFFPLRYRVPFVSAVGVLWTAYLSLLNSETTE